MLANHAARVAPVRARLRAKARCVGGELHRQRRFCQHLVAHKIGQWHFTGRDEVQRRVVRHRLALLAALVGGKQIAFKFGQLAGAGQAVGVHDVGHVTLGIAVLLGLHVQHECAERPVQARDGTFHHGEARAGELHAHVKVQPQGRADIDVVFDIERKFWLLAPCAYDDVAVLVSTHGHAGVWQVRHRQ